MVYINAVPELTPGPYESSAHTWCSVPYSPCLAQLELHLSWMCRVVLSCGCRQAPSINGSQSPQSVFGPKHLSGKLVGSIRHRAQHQKGLEGIRHVKQASLLFHALTS